MDQKILLTGTVRNVALTLQKELNTVLKALSIFNSVEIFLVESDSNDDTVKILQQLQITNVNFRFSSQGQLSANIPNRIDRIAVCRNIYVEYIKNNYQNKAWDYIAVADLDGMNFRLSKRAVESCFKTPVSWDGVMANQIFGYYDIYALRAPGWNEQNCFDAIQLARVNSSAPKVLNNSYLNFINQFIYFDKFRKIYIYSKMKIINPRNQCIKVTSAFGGFAIYKLEVFLHSFYSSPDKSTSEHVYFHTTFDNKNRKFYINPKLINNWSNPYNINKILFIRFAREFKKFINSKRCFIDYLLR